MVGGTLTTVVSGYQSTNPRKFRRRIRRRWRQGKLKFRNLVPSFGTGIPESIVMKMKYTAVLSYNSITTSPFYHFFKINDLYDPDQTGVGHQPYYFDQISNLWARYTVYGCKMDIRTVATVGNPAVIMKGQRDVTPVGTADLAMERPDTKYVLMTSGGDQKRLSRYYPINKVFGITKSGVNDDDLLSGAFNASPSRVYYVQIIAQSPDNTTSVAGHITVDMTFYCRWYDRIRHSQS